MLQRLIQWGRRILSSGLFSWLDRIPWISPGVTVPSPDENLGLAGEIVAAKFLKRLGYRIIAHSHRQRLGEIDLIAVHEHCLIFVEVKTWRSDDKADPSEAVTASKQHKLTRAALVYMKKHGLLDQPARFDVISVVWAKDSSEPRIRHFISAFEASGHGQLYS